MAKTTLTKIAVLVLVATLGYAFGRHRSALEAQAIQDAEYVRVVGAIADAYNRDPSEVEQDAGLVDDKCNIIRGAR